METLLIALAVLAASAAVSVALVLSGRLRRVAGRAMCVMHCLLETRERPSKLSHRERAELVARLWVPW